MFKRLSFTMAGLAMFVLAVPASAGHIYCSFTGSKQGKFHGDHGLNGDATQIPAFSLTEEITVPIDAATGFVSGKRQHAPLTIIKALDRSSPQFFAAAVTNETLSSVTCMLYRDVERERISLAYRRIEVTDLDSGTTAIDDWSSPAI